MFTRMCKLDYASAYKKFAISRGHSGSVRITSMSRMKDQDEGV